MAETGFYVDLRRNERLGTFITVYDEEIIHNHEKFRGKSYNMKVDEDKLVELFRESVSIILYGRRCIEIGIREKIVHPDAVSTMHGVEVAIFIDVHI